jgi:hypothetical protein
MAADREHSIDQCSILMEAAANQGVWKLYCGGGPPLSAATARYCVEAKPAAVGLPGIGLVRPIAGCAALAIGLSRFKK